MAELAAGAVGRLLGVIHNEALLLGRVQGDVQFIKEEMESINSFLSHLARTAASAGRGQDDEQLRTWMKQVRDLAHDCSNCIDLYLRRGDPAVHRARGGLRRYLWWASWFVHKMVAQHNAAIQLSELKERARDVSERRARYDVKLPEKEAAGGSTPLLSSRAPFALAAIEDDDDEGGGQNQAADDQSVNCSGALEPQFLEDYCREKLVGWLKQLEWRTKDDSIPSIAFVAPATEDSGATARDLLPFNFNQTVCINLPEVHRSWDPLLPEEILCYILQKYEPQATAEGEKALSTGVKAYSYKENVLDQIDKMIGEADVSDKIERIKSNIGKVGSKRSKYTSQGSDKHKMILGMLHQALTLSQCRPYTPMPFSWEEIIDDMAYMLKYYMEEPSSQFLLEVSQYRDILRKVFPAGKKTEETRTLTTNPPLGEDHIKQIIESHKIALDIIRELLAKPQWLQGSSDKEQATGVLSGVIENDTTVTAKEEANQKGNISSKIKELQLAKPELLQGNYDKEQAICVLCSITNNDATAAEKEAKQRMDEISWEIAAQLRIKGVADKINKYLAGNKILIVLQDDEDYISSWEETRNALGLIARTGSAVIVTTNKSERAKDFCCPPTELVTYSHVGLYNDIILQLTSEKRKNDGSYDPQILHGILERCDPHEFAMKIFMHDLYANPNWSSQDLRKLHDDLDSRKSVGGSKNIANTTMLKFSYNNLPREYKSCLLYLAIFPPGFNIRKSTLVGRWVAEGLITKEDWASAVRHAERCFDVLIDRWLVYPAELSATGGVKSCKVGDKVHEFIKKIATKERILDARLSHTWARRFSIFSELQLRASDSIDKFVHKLPRYSQQLSLLKGLYLDECKCFNKNRYLKSICNNILLLKYLSLRNTNFTHLPREINNLHKLEILDIRQTNVPASETRHVLLLKLKRLLAGHVDSSLSCSHDIRDDKSLYSAVEIPSNIKKMDNMEVLSNVMASQDGDELEDIRNLWRLRKLGVVIEDKKVHLEKFLRVISDLKDRIQSLSITLHTYKSDGTLSYTDLSLKHNVKDRLEKTSNRLESLSINGVTCLEKLLSLLTKGGNELTKLTLRSTLLNQENLNDLAVLPNLRCVRLQYQAYTGPKLTFKKGEFQCLSCFLVDGLRMTDIIEFEGDAAPELEKIALSLTSIKSLVGVGALSNLKELELKGNELLKLVEDEVEDGILDFKKMEFQHLEHLLVEAPVMTKIIFEDGAAPELKKITLSLDNIESLDGVGNLPKLTDLELKGHNNLILLSFFNNGNRITKVTLRDTLLNQCDLQVLAKKQHMICCLVLLELSYNESHLVFNKDEFPKLKLLSVNCSAITNISFSDGATPRLEKITWFSRKMESLSGIKNLPKLKELEFHSDHVPYQVRKDIKAYGMNLDLTHRVPEEHQAQTKEDKKGDDDHARFPFSCFSKRH